MRTRKRFPPDNRAAHAFAGHASRIVVGATCRGVSRRGYNAVGERLHAVDAVFLVGVCKETQAEATS